MPLIRWPIKLNKQLNRYCQDLYEEKSRILLSRLIIKTNKQTEKLSIHTSMCSEQDFVYYNFPNISEYLGSTFLFKILFYIQYILFLLLLLP